ncbi:MAG: hypothetical protein ACTHL8_01845 [Burkholderiaceae bacterium]
MKATGTIAWAVAGAAAYAAASHLLMTHAADAPWAVAVLLGPLVAAAGTFAWRSGKALARAGVVLAVAALAWVVARGGVGTVGALYVAQHAGLHAALGVGFGATLRQPLSMIGRVAARVHALTPAMVAYTRHVTLAWTIYFFAMAALSVAVWRLAPWSAWSLLANVLTPAAIGALFVGEYLLRYRLHPEFERVPLRAAIGAWRANAAAPEARP